MSALNDGVMVAGRIYQDEIPSGGMCNFINCGGPQFESRLDFCLLHDISNIFNTNLSEVDVWNGGLTWNGGVHNSIVLLIELEKICFLLLLTI